MRLILDLQIQPKVLHYCREHRHWFDYIMTVF